MEVHSREGGGVGFVRKIDSIVSVASLGSFVPLLLFMRKKGLSIFQRFKQ